MNKHRIMLLIPEGLTFDMLSEEQQAAINRVFGEYLLPMIGTVPAEGRVICDALVSDAFDPQAMTALGLPFEIIGMWSFDGTNIIPFNEAEFVVRLPDTVTYDDGGNVLASEPPVLHEPCTWGGWPKVIGI